MEVLNTSTEKARSLSELHILDVYITRNHSPMSLPYFYRVHCHFLLYYSGEGNIFSHNVHLAWTSRSWSHTSGLGYPSPPSRYTLSSSHPSGVGVCSVRIQVICLNSHLWFIIQKLFFENAKLVKDNLYWLETLNEIPLSLQKLRVC